MSEKRAQFVPSGTLGEVDHEQVVWAVFEVVHHRFVVPVVDVEGVGLVVLGKAFSPAVDPFVHRVPEVADVARHAFEPALRIADGEDEFAAWHQSIEVLVHERPRVVFHRVELLQLAEHPVHVAVEVRPKHLVVVVPHTVPQGAQRVAQRRGAGFLEADADNQGRRSPRHAGKNSARW